MASFCYVSFWNLLSSLNISFMRVIDSSSSFQVYIVFSNMNMPKLIYPFSCWWIFMLFLFFLFLSFFLSSLLSLFLPPFSSSSPSLCYYNVPVNIPTKVALGTRGILSLSFHFLNFLIYTFNGYWGCQKSSFMWITSISI